MGRSATSPHQELPSVSFTTVSGEYLKRNGVQDFQARSYGFNDGEDWQRPESYVRYIEPLESELATQVEYDMDEQDQEWLEAVNKERKTNSQNRVSYEIFEVIMDRLEKGWFDLTKNLHKSDMPLPSEDATCAICDDSEVENTNAIVFCDGCNLAVHQDCYGVPYIPEGQWLCRKCTVSPENPVSCLLCPNEGGAFKQSTSGEWIHLLCAIWIPETRVANETFMEPITGTDRISKQRWRLKCSACDVREGACIQCTKSSCFLAFHVTCARKEKLLMPMKAGAGQEPPPLQCFCEKHLPRERIKPRLEALEAEAAATALLERDPKAAKAARAYAKGYKPGPPIVPSILIRRIERYVDKVKIRGASEFIEMVARYWSLKREARRGAPLLKRLHLEPWTASAGGKVQTDEEKSRKLELMKALRADLERVKQLVDQVRRREIVKRDRAQTLHGITSAVVFAPIEKMRVALLTIEAADKHSVFKNPVSHAEAPGYYEVVKRPMCWSIIEARLDGYQYWDLKLFKADINLIFDNAMAYNVSGSPIHKLALRLKNIAAPVLESLDRLQTSAISQVVVDQGELDFTETAQSKEVNPLPTSPTKSSPVLIPPHELPIGDLEPPFELLSLFKSPTVANESAIVINSDPLDSFFSHELPVDKPKPPPRSRSAKRKDRKLSTAKTKADALDASPGFRAPARRSLHTATGDGPSNVNADPLTASSGDAHVEPNLSAMPEEPKRRKPKQILPGQDSSIVEDVSNQDSFKKFNSGWILPENARRNGRRAPNYHISGQSVPRGRSKNSSVRAGSSIAASSPLAAMRDLAGQPDTQLESSPLASAAPRLPSSSDGPVRDVEPSISATPSAQINLPVTNSPAMESSLHLEDIAREERDLPSLRPAVESTFNAGSASGNTEERAYEFSSFPSSQPTDVSTGSLPALDVTSLSLHALSLEARPPSHTEGAQLSSLNRPTSPYLPIEPPFTVESNDSRFEPPKIANTLEQAGASTSAVQQPASNLEDSPGANPADESFSHHDMSLSPVKSPSRNGLSSRASSPLHASQEIGAFDDGQPTQEWDEDPLPGYAISSFEVLPPSPDPSTPQSERQEYSPREWLYSLPGLNDIQSFASGDPAPPQPSIFTATTGDHTTEPQLSVPSPSALPLSLNDLSREETPHPITETEAAVPPVTHSTPPASQRSSSPLSPVPRLRPLKPNEKLVYDPDGTAVIEEIDSPTARRQNQLNRRNRKQDDVEMISLSNGKAQGKRKKTGGRKGGARGRASASGRMTSRDESVNEDVQHEDGMLDPSKKVEGGTLVWAKSKSWPFFPAVVWEVDNPAVPKAVLKEYEKQTKSTTTTVLVVQFFDRKRFWSAVDMKNLRLLFDYPDVDAKMLSPRNCNSRMREQIRQAYRQAQAEIEDEGASVAGDTPDVDNATDDIETAAGHADVEMESALSDAI